MDRKSIGTVLTAQSLPILPKPAFSHVVLKCGAPKVNGRDHKFYNMCNGKHSTRCRG